ncbi:PulJ/GspJ family protein [Hansschlegelia zhihuaiae]|uniref:Uncharacterized protein n=1 Tax=Hansschlegelia zhihuaiae TaxID=405005 RepID=A0A4Q0MAQ9_9HYPH|nr:hypothetical protein [Hansschlegelia zhihuaiae]RXF70284.1 hypothetical protein EK403_17165 [Hansschlegelia zhihuaiae]
MRGEARRRGSEGFLLIEALSAFALSALILVALLSLMGLLRRSADRAAASVETMEVTGRTLATIAGEIRLASRRRWAAEPGLQGGPARGPAQPAPRADEDPDGRRRPTQGARQDEAEGGEGGPGQSEAQRNRPFVFSGSPDRVLFALNPEQASGFRAPVLVAYQIDPSGAVLRAEGALPPNATGPGAVRLGPVARIEPGPERLRFAYVERQPNGGEVIVDVWANPLQMPAAVRIDRTDPATGLLLGSLRTPLLLDGEPGCAEPQKSFCSRVEKAQAAAGQTPQPTKPSASGEQE